MRFFYLNTSSATEYADPTACAERHRQEPGFVWVACTRSEFEGQQSELQALLQACGCAALVDLHVSDLLNAQLPSRYDYTSQYDVLVFRRLAAGHGRPAAGEPPLLRSRSGPPILHRIDTSPVGFVVYDRVLLTVHPADCTARDTFASKLLQSASTDSRVAGARLPTSPADLMLRIVNLMVDGFLELRRELTHQLDHWQSELIDPSTRFVNWSSLLQARLALHTLDEICEDQRAAIQDWVEAVKTWPDAANAAEQRERDLLQVRGRDVLEHIERVVHHVRRLEQSVETAVQLHFSVQGSRTNNIMRTLTAITAIFLPLNLITGFFGMNFDALPLIHQKDGVWLAVGIMATIGVGLILFFWRKRYLARTGQ